MMMVDIYYKVIAIDKDHLESKFNMDPKKEVH